MKTRKLRICFIACMMTWWCCRKWNTVYIIFNRRRFYCAFVLCTRQSSDKPCHTGKPASFGRYRHRRAGYLYKTKRYPAYFVLYSKCIFVMVQHLLFGQFIAKRHDHICIYFHIMQKYAIWAEKNSMYKKVNSSLYKIPLSMRLEWTKRRKAVWRKTL